MDKILLTNIQRFSLHDGPGIRTTVFLKGCSLHCPWCSNPENISPKPQTFIKNGVRGVYGEYYSTNDLISECLKDKAFYSGKINDSNLWSITKADEIDDLPGGVTFSGGEALLQIKQLIPVCEALHYQGIHIVTETSLFVPPQNLYMALHNIDFFYVDMKIMNSTIARDIECGDLGLFYTNLDVLIGSNIPLVVRVPVIGTYTDGEKNRSTIKKILEQYKKRILKIELIKEHNLGERKYKSLGLEMSYHGVNDESLECYKMELSDLDIPIEICKI